MTNTTELLNDKIGKTIGIAFVLIMMIGAVLYTTPVPIISKGHAAEDSGDKKARIAVMSQKDFVPDQAKQSGMVKSGQVGLPDQLASRIVQHLSKSNRFVPVDRKALRRVVLEQRFDKKMGKTYKDKALDKAISDMDKVTGDAVEETGKLADFNDLMKDFKDLGSAVKADYIVVGNLDRLEKKNKNVDIAYTDSIDAQTEVINAALRLRILDVDNGTVLGATNVNAQLSKKLYMNPSNATGQYEMFEKLAKRATREIIDITFPAKIVKTDPMVISRGSNSGAKKGTVFKIQRKGDPIKNEGIVISHLKDDIGEVKVKTVQTNVSVVEPVSGSNFQQGDLAIRSEKPSEFASASGQASRDRGKTGEEGVKGDQATLIVGDINVNRSGRIEGFGSGEVDRFINELVVKLGNTNRFKVLDRQELQQVLDEQSFNALVSGQTPSQKLKQMTQGDYVLNGEISHFYTNRSTSSRAYTDEKVVEVSGNAKGIVRLVDVRTGEVADAEEVQLTEDFGNADPTSMESELMDEFSTSWVDKITETIFPPKIIGQSGGSIYVNRGSSTGMEQGTVYDLMRPGEKLTGVDSDVSFGRAEEKIGKIKITSVRESRARAELIEGENIQKGDILRNPRKPQKEQEQEAEPVQDVNW